MKTNKVTQATPLSKTEALIQARHIVGSAANTISIAGEQADPVIKQKQEQKIAAEAISLMKQSSAKVLTQTSSGTKKSSSSEKNSSDPLDTLSRVESENSSTESTETDDPLASERKKSLQTASYYILTSTFKSMSSKFVNMFRGETKRNYQKTAIYQFEKATSVTESSRTSSS